MKTKPSISASVLNPLTPNFSIGGMEELTLDQIKNKSELEQDIDFENGDLECCFRPSVKKQRNFEILNI